MEKTQGVQDRVAVDSENSPHPEPSMADHISTSTRGSILQRRRPRIDAPLMNRPALRRWIVLGYFTALALIAFWPSPVDGPIDGQLGAVLEFLHRRGIPQWIDYGFVEASGNVLLFVPAGLLLKLTLPRLRWWQLLAFGAAVSATVEFGQLLFLPHRFSSWQDVMMNTTGVGIGLACTALFNWLRARQTAVSES
ncbi:VanZ family protein [bacterium RCC_150]